MGNNENTGVVAPDVSYTIVGQSGAEHVFLQIPLTVNAKGLKTFLIDLDEFDLIETGVKEKNGKPVQYMRFKTAK